jgi:hypothetical protein
VEPSLDASGSLVSFSSSAPEVTGSGFVRQAVVRDLAAGRTDVVSTALLGETASAAANPGVISGDGRSVAFYSAAGNLVDGDTNGVSDVFVKSYPQPEVHAATPSVLGPGTTTVLVNGARFAAPTDVLLLDAPPGMTVGAVTVLGPDKLEVAITVTREVPEGTSPGLVVRNLGLFPGDLGASGVCSGCLVVG